MKQWFIRAVQIIAGAFIGSIVLENITRLAVWQLVPRIYDVQFALLITIIALFGGIFGAVSVVTRFLAKAQRFKLAGWLALVFGALGSAFSIPNIITARDTFDDNKQPFIDAFAYYGFVSLWSVMLFVWGVSLLLKKQNA